MADNHIRVDDTNWRALNSMKKQGETFNDVVSRLIEENDHMQFIGGELNE